MAVLAVQIAQARRAFDPGRPGDFMARHAVEHDQIFHPRAHPAAFVAFAVGADAQDYFRTAVAVEVVDREGRVPHARLHAFAQGVFP